MERVATGSGAEPLALRVVEGRSGTSLGSRTASRRAWVNAALEDSSSAENDEPLNPVRVRAGPSLRVPRTRRSTRGSSEFPREKRRPARGAGVLAIECRTLAPLRPPTALAVVARGRLPSSPSSVTAALAAERAGSRRARASEFRTRRGSASCGTCRSRHVTIARGTAELALEGQCARSVRRLRSRMPERGLPRRRVLAPDEPRARAGRGS